MMLETNIDDMSSEIYSYLMDQLMAYALDVFYTPIQMKKNRPATKLSVLVSKENLPEVERIILMETTTFGIRKYPVERSVLDREFIEMETRFGLITIKHGFLENELIKVTPEYESCRLIALKEKMPIRDVYQKILEDIQK